MTILQYMNNLDPSIKMMTRWPLFLLLLSFISCKMEQKEQQNEGIDENVSIKSELKTTDFFQVEMDAVVLKDDVFQLFYKEYNDEGFSEERMIVAAVTGNTSEQPIRFDIPGGVLPNGLRLDLGDNPKQDPIKLNRLKIGFDQKEYNLKGASFSEVFTPNDFIVFNETERVITTRTVGEAYDPYFVAEDLDQIVFHLMN